jgi:two-component system phosphate regulon sensor histidine kinase PhoR
MADELPAIAADRSQILQLLDNLIANALRYGEAGTPVTISAQAEGPMVHLSVSDEGEGIAPEHIARVTERFYRVDTSRSRSLGGTGLGLSIVKHVAAGHGGEATVWSAAGTGSTFTLRLPVAAGSIGSVGSAAAPGAASPTATPTGPEGTSMTRTTSEGRR